MVMLHGCTIGDGTCRNRSGRARPARNVGNCLIRARALITEGKEFPDGSMILGSPAKAVRELTPEQASRLGFGTQSYVRNWQRFKAGLSAL